MLSVLIYSWLTTRKATSAMGIKIKGKGGNQNQRKTKKEKDPIGFAEARERRRLFQCLCQPVVIFLLTQDCKSFSQIDHEFITFGRLREPCSIASVEISMMIYWGMILRILYLCIDPIPYGLIGFVLVTSSMTLCSWVWTSIMKYIGHMENKVKYSTGSGKNTFFWLNQWHPLGILAPNLVMIYTSLLDLIV
ncbi:hypothetical protein NE237_001728 [Protea cynaroides]|uniref:Uncharacterized protein n=1 Tax=Protea cynaroides TaxID=273540 RepID=A0A9Q0KTW6_9MAGN|nr:hypothetical protein NE237_001728 [Protea cynaroides]